MKLQSSCVQKIKGEQDLKELQKKAGHVVLLLHSKNCGHCKEDEADLNNTCPTFGKDSPIVFAKCDVSTEEGCNELWMKSKPSNVQPEDYGIPVKVGLNQNNDVSNPAWHILGRDTDKMNMIMGKIKQAMTSQGQQPSESQERQPQQRVGNPFQQFANRFVSDHDSQKKLMLVRSGLPEQKILCATCDSDSRLQSMKQYIMGY